MTPPGLYFLMNDARSGVTDVPTNFAWGHEILQQVVDKVRQLRSRLIEILNVPQEGTPPVSTRLRPCWTAFLNSLRAILISFGQ
jgi:hypothetical protein